MKTKQLLKYQSLALITGLTVSAALWVTPEPADGQVVYETNYYAGTIGEYDGTTGATINATLVSGLRNPFEIAVSGGHLYVTYDNSVGEYDATTGAPINASLITGLNGPSGIAVSGNTL